MYSTDMLLGVFKSDVKRGTRGGSNMKNSEISNCSNEKYAITATVMYIKGALSDNKLSTI
jgi:hypothetical protein